MEFLINSGILYALVLGKKNAVQDWMSVIGPYDPDIARRESPSRYSYINSAQIKVYE